jgi:hypothetical protein
MNSDSCTPTWQACSFPAVPMTPQTRHGPCETAISTASLQHASVIAASSTSLLGAYPRRAGRRIAPARCTPQWPAVRTRRALCAWHGSCPAAPRARRETIAVVAHRRRRELTGPRTAPQHAAPPAAATGFAVGRSASRVLCGLSRASRFSRDVAAACYELRDECEQPRLLTQTAFVQDLFDGGRH